MTLLEVIGLNELRKCVYSIIDRANEKNQERMQHERSFILSDAKKALEIINALEENNAKPIK